MAGADIPVDRRALAAWLTDALGRDIATDTLAISRPSGGGWSNDTLFVDVRGAPVDRVVVRLAPSGPAMFPFYDLAHQIKVMRRVASSGHVAVPAVLADDTGGARLGRPAFVMSFVPGRVPVDDRPSFAEAGFLHDADPADQRTFHTGLLDAIVRVHQTDTRAFAPARDSGDSTVQAALDDLQATWRFDPGDRWSDTVDHAFAALAEGVPEPGEDLLLWGDARPANVIVDNEGFRPIALLDWELATIGPPELELTWLAEMNRMRMQGSGVAPLPGFLSDESAIDYYEVRTGRTLGHLAWFTLFSATRVAALMHRHLRVMVHLGRLPADHRLLTRTIASDRVADLLGDDRGRRIGS